MKSQTRKRGAIWGGLMILFGGMALLATTTDLSAWTWVAVLAAAGFLAFLVFLTDRSDLGLLLPTYVLWAIAALIALIELDILRDPYIAPLVLTAVALPFLVVFLRDRNQWWALIPFYVLLVVAVMIGLTDGGVLDDDLEPAFILYAIAIPFFVIYARNPKQWWPLIPGVILAVIASSFLVAEAMFEYVGAAVLILIGAWMLARQFIRRNPTEVETADAAEPEIDEPPTQ